MTLADKPTIEIYGREAANYAKRDKGGRADGFLEPFLAAMPPGAVTIDLGSGAGWAAEMMVARGFDVHALDACPEFAAIAATKIKRPVRIMSYEGIDDVDFFDGIWASGALLHVRKADLPGLLVKLTRALKPGGLLLATFKEGHGEERDKLGRFYAYYQLDELKALVEKTPGLSWQGHLEARSVDFAGKENTVYGIKGRKAV